MGYKEIYDAGYFQGKTSWFWRKGYGVSAEGYFRHLSRPFEPYLKMARSGKIIDIGCAFGFMLERTTEDVKKFGLDVSTYALGKARGVTEKLINANTEQLPLRDKSFEAVLLNDVLEHLFKPEEAVREIGRILIPGGLLYITTPNPNLLRRVVYSIPDRLEHHVSMFSHQDLKLLLEETGFRVLEHWTYTNIDLGKGVEGSLRLPLGLGLESGFICQKI